MNKIQDIPDSEKRVVTGIDVLRGLFAALVVGAHATLMVPGLREASTDSLPARVFETAMRQGLLWVIGFFVISGFCIQRSIAGMMATGEFDLGRYLRARVTRIYPFYLIGMVLALAVGMLARPEEITAGKVAAALTMTQGIFGLLPAFEISWSLTHEMAYYVACGWLVRHAKGDWRRVFTQGLWLSLGGTLAVLGLWVLGGKFGGGVSPPWAIPMMMPIWLSGAWTSWQWDRLKHVFRSSKRLVVLLVVSFGAVYPVYLWYWIFSNRLLPLQLINLGLMPFFCLLLLVPPRLKFLDDLRVRRLAGKLGLLSYPLYLLHSPLQNLMSSMWPALKEMRLEVQWSLHVAVPVLFCWIAAIPLESGLLAWRQRYLKSCSNRS